MNKKDDEKGQRKLTVAQEWFDLTRSIIGTKKPQDRLDEADRAIKDDSKEEKPGLGPFFKRLLKEAKEREELQILDGLDYPGGKGVH